MVASDGGSFGRFLWYELMTTDMEAAKAFYAKVVGWGMRDASMPGMPYTLFTVGKTSFSGVMNQPGGTGNAGTKPRWMGFVGVDDVDAMTERARRLGGVVLLPPTDIPNVSRFSVFADPQAAPLALFKWLKAGQEAPPNLSAPGRAGWHELVTNDCDKALAFYGELFGWQKADADVVKTGTYQRFSAAGQTIGGMFAKPDWVPVPLWIFYFTVGDIDSAAMRVKAGGGQIVNGPMEMPSGGWIVECTDPQGGAFGLIGKRSNKIGFFERTTLRDAADVRSGLRK